MWLQWWGVLEGWHQVLNGALAGGCMGPSVHRPELQTLTTAPAVPNSELPFVSLVIELHLHMGVGISRRPRAQRVGD